MEDPLGNELQKILDEKKIEDVCIGINDIYVCNNQDFAEMQIGTRTDEDGIYNEGWVGEDFYRIGTDSLCGDLILVKMEKDLPIYFMFHDDDEKFSSLEKISESFTGFLSALEYLQTIDVKQMKKENISVVVEEVLKYTKCECNYWQDICLSEYEFLDGDE